MLCTSLILGLHLATAHVRQDLNNFNPGIYANCDNAVVGIYENSVRKTTVYAGYSVVVGPVNVLFGAATGYGKLRPVLVPSTQLGDFRVHLLLPSGGNRRGGVHISYEWQ